MKREKIFFDDTRKQLSDQMNKNNIQKKIVI